MFHLALPARRTNQKHRQNRYYSLVTWFCFYHTLKGRFEAILIRFCWFFGGRAFVLYQVSTPVCWVFFHFSVFWDISNHLKQIFFWKIYWPNIDYTMYMDLYKGLHQVCLTSLTHLSYDNILHIYLIIFFFWASCLIVSTLLTIWVNQSLSKLINVNQSWSIHIKKVMCIHFRHPCQIKGFWLTLINFN